MALMQFFRAASKVALKKLVDSGKYKLNISFVYIGNSIHCIEETCGREEHTGTMRNLLHSLGRKEYNIHVDTADHLVLISAFFDKRSRFL